MPEPPDPVVSAMRQHERDRAEARYERLEELGRGGMAVVFRARDRKLGREVALKLMREDVKMDAEGVARFRREAETAAKLSHPNVVTVLDAGEDGGRMYIAMELVSGEPLNRLLAARRAEPRVVVTLLEKVARGVQHAHERGIVHRDLKPGNVLVTPQGEPKVADFGLAHLAGRETALTQSGALLGTPLYMAPEQAVGRTADISARTDVYALGAMLYEALTGRPPHVGDTPIEICRRIADEDPVTPRQLNARVSRDLETVALMAIDKEPSRRYATAGAFADDLARWLHGEAVSARPASLAWRIRRRLAKRKGLVAGVAGVVATVVVAAIVVPKWRAAAAELERERRTRERTELYVPLEAELDLLRMNFYRGDYRLTDDEARKYEDVVAKIRAQMEKTGETAQGWHLVGRCREIVAAFDDADAAYERALACDAGHARTLLARGRQRIERAIYERVYADESAMPRAIEDVRAAIEMIDRAAGESMEADLARAYLAALRLWEGGPEFDPAALLAKWRGQRYAEEFLLVGAIGSFTRREERATEAIARVPSMRAAWFWRGVARKAAGLLDEARTDFDRAIEIHPRFPEPYVNRGNIKQLRGDHAGAMADYDRAIALGPRFAPGYYNRANSRKALGDIDGALADFDRAIELHPTHLEALANRANTKRERGNLDAALAEYDHVLRLHPTSGPAHLGRALVHRKRGDAGAAFADLERAIEVQPDYAEAYFTRGHLHAARDAAAALRDYTRAIELDPRHVSARVNRGLLRKAAGDLRGALADYDRAIELAPDLAVAYYNRAGVRQATGDLRAALRDYDRAIDRDPRFSEALANRGGVRGNLGDHDGAIADCDRALEIDPRCIYAWLNRGNARRGKGDERAATADYSRAIEIEPRYLEAYNNRANARQALGDLDGAIADYERVLELDPKSLLGFTNRGLARKLKGDARGAATDLRRALELAPAGWPHRGMVEKALQELQRGP